MNKVLPLLACAALLSSCAPTMNALSRANTTPAVSLSAPLLAGQTWDVDGGSIAVRSAQSIKVVEVFETAPGIYSNLDSAGLVAAQRGKPEQGATLFPAVSFSRLGQRMEFYWSENGTDYNCRIENVTPNSTLLKGRFYLSGTEFGTCTAKLR